jgi:hypothetical protein
MKKYALKNSYFKVAKSKNLPDTLTGILLYKNAYGELPFKYDGDNWVYDAFCESQKRYGVSFSQILTPDDTVVQLLDAAYAYFTTDDVLEPCCGTGQITKALIENGYNVTAFDIDPEMCRLCHLLYPGLKDGPKWFNFRAFKGIHNQIIANPPFEIKELTDFLNWISDRQKKGGISILLLPKGFIQKDKPKALLQTIQKFAILEKEDMRAEFERTKIRAEIVVLKKL